YVLTRADWRKAWWRFALGAAVPVLVLLVYQKICFGSFLTPAPSMSTPFLQPKKVAGMFGLPNPRNIVLMFFGPGRALFWQTPVLLLAVPGAIAWYRARRVPMLALSLSNIVAYTLSVTAMDTYQGGVTTSMRYMIVALPYFCLLLPDVCAFAWRK